VVSELTLQQGRRLEFRCAAWQGDVLVMQGAHHRAVLDRRRFSQAEADTGAVKTIEFWFDYHSPWCYFASHRVSDIAREFNAELIWKPVHLANLNAAVDGRRPLEANANFLAWYYQDMLDTAAMQGLPFEKHHAYPCRPSRALRASICAAEQGLAAGFVTTVMRGYWSGQRDISDADWLCRVATDAGIDADRLRDAMTSLEYKEKLQKNLEEAMAARLFGLPVARVDGKIFWGNDRLDLLRHYLSGKPPQLSAVGPPLL
jgi:2-hydroxychromene-2-carboxylate isomerase